MLRGIGGKTRLGPQRFHRRPTLFAGTMDCSARSLMDIETIMSRYAPIDPGVRRREYEQAGWSGFDPKAPPYKPDHAEIERIRRRYE